MQLLPRFISGALIYVAAAKEPLHRLTLEASRAYVQGFHKTLISKMLLNGCHLQGTARDKRPRAIFMWGWGEAY